MKKLDNFIDKAIEKYGDKFDYSKVQYVNVDTKVVITCPEHGEFEQTPYKHLKGKHGCKRCGERAAAQSKFSTTEEFIAKAREVHGDKYSYENTIYTEARNKLTITCPIHGDFEQLASGHLAGYGCKKCTSYGKGRVDMNSPCTLYYLYLKDVNLYKIGITAHTISTRYRTQFDRDQFDIVFTCTYPTGRDAFTKEQLLLKSNASLIYDGPKVLSSGNTELFTQDIFNGDYSEFTP